MTSYKKKQTPIRIWLEELRLKNNESKKTMLEKIQYGKVYINRIENGEKPAPEKLLQNIISAYSLDEAEEERLRIAAWASTDVCMLDISDLSYEERIAVWKQNVHN